ncbi:MAG TPA: hypothetical protein VFP89_14960 [Propionibacteriaceae bacterium]|nr:hypothetical protein [Propionibacteriaceae bacterium]
MSVTSTTGHDLRARGLGPSGTVPRPTVPWSTVISLAVVLAFADGFWLTTVRDAVGAVERTQKPFTSFWHESTLMLPVFVFAVLAALTVALRRFGPELRRARTVMITALLVVAAATAVAILEMGVSSTYDYYLQSRQLAMMNSMHGICSHDCLDQAQHATLLAHVRAVGYTSAFVLVTNTVLVCWMVMMRGGRLNVSRTPTRRLGADLVASPPNRPRVEGLRVPLIAGLLGSAAIHAITVPGQLASWPAGGAFLVLLCAAQVAAAATMIIRPGPGPLIGASVVSIGPLLLWLWSRTLGIPLGPGADTPAAPGVSDVAACALEIGALLVAVLLLSKSGAQRRPAASPHAGALATVAVIAITTIGLAGTASGWLDIRGASGQHSVMGGHR